MSSGREAIVRAALPEDMPRIRELANQLSARAERPFTGLPELKRDENGDYRKPGYLLEMWVVELDGQIINAFYLEKCLEFCMVGADPIGTAAAKRFAGGPIATAQEMGLRAIHSHVPSEFRDVSKHLEDPELFTRTGYEHFTIRLA